MFEIPLGGGLVAIVDDADAELVRPFSWCASPSTSSQGGHYAHTKIDGRTVYMHRLLMNAGAAQVDHADHDGLNNRRSNLRLCTASQNNMNRRAYSKSGFKGVYRNGSYGDGSPRWRVVIGRPDKRAEGGSFRCQKAAAERYNELALEHYGEFACLNRVAGA